MGYYDKDTLHEYTQVRNKMLKDMPRYMKGELKGSELNNFKKLSKQANEIQRELDHQYMSNKYKNNEKFWDDWARIHN